MTRKIHKQLLSLVDDWAKSLDQRDEAYNLIIPNALEEEIDKLAGCVQVWRNEQSKRAKKQHELAKKKEVHSGRMKIELPSNEEIKKKLMKQTITNLAKELQGEKKLKINLRIHLTVCF